MVKLNLLTHFTTVRCIFHVVYNGLISFDVVYNMLFSIFSIQRIVLNNQEYEW